MNKISRKTILGIIVTFLVLATLPTLTLAEWPTRPEGEPTPTPRPTKVGAGIELFITGAVEPYYAIVQWQDGLGDWHDIDGWRGKVSDNHVLWYIAKRTFGTGPYRWVVYDDTGVLGSSEPFDMPNSTGQVAKVSVAIEP